MKLSNRLYRLQYRSAKNFNTTNYFIQSQQRQYQKQLSSIDTILDIMYTAFKNNMKMQEIYLDLIKAHGRNVRIRGKDIKYVYSLLSENKTAEIIFGKLFQKQQKERKQRQQITRNIWTQRQGNNSKIKDIMIATVSKILRKASTQQSQLSTTSQQKLSLTQKEPFYQQLLQQQARQQKYYQKILLSNYKRLYSRLVEEITKKLTYYIINKTKLYGLIIYSIAQISKKLETILRRINDIKNNRLILDVVKLVFNENMLIEQKIYQALVNEGHVVSIEEFFRVSGKMMEQPNYKYDPRSSRYSVMSGKLSVISSISSQNQDFCQQIQIKRNSRFQQQKKRVTKQKKSRTSQKIGLISKFSDTQKSQKQLKNVVHIQRVHKQIQTKYASSLDKISDLLVNNEEKISYQQGISKQNKKKQSNKIDHEQQVGQQNKHRDSQSSTQNPFGRWKRQNEKRKTTIKKKTITAFQFFSPQFKKIINELDEKKGKVPLRMYNTADATVFHDQSQQHYGKITNETISLKNPLNVARLIGKRFKTIASSQFKYITKSNIMRNMARQKTQINQLLKMYQDDQKQNQLRQQQNFKKGNTINLNQQHMRIQKDVIKQRLMRKIQMKKSTMMVNGNITNIHNKKLNKQFKKQVQSEYKRLLRDQKLNQQLLQDNDGRQVCQNTNGYEFEEFDMNYQNIQKFDKKVSKVNIKDKNGLKVQSIGRQSKDEPVILNKFHLKRKKNNQTVSNTTTPDLNETIQPLKLSNLQKIYNQFTNPLTLKYGFYHDQKYQSLRNNLEKCQINAIKLKKCLYKKQHQLVVRKNVAFGESNLDASVEDSNNNQSSYIGNIFNLRTQRGSHQNLMGNRSSPSQNNKNIFFLTPSPISTPKLQVPLPSNTKDLNQCVQKQYQIKHFHKKLSTTKIQNKQQQRKIQSLRSTPRNSCGRRNQVYSTQRRIKIK